MDEICFIKLKLATSVIITTCKENSSLMDHKPQQHKKKGSNGDGCYVDDGCCVGNGDGCCVDDGCCVGNGD